MRLPITGTFSNQKVEEMKFNILDISHALADAICTNARYAGSTAADADDKREDARDVMRAELSQTHLPSAGVKCSDKALAGMYAIADMIAFMKEHKHRFPSDASIEKYMRACTRSEKLAPGKAFLKKAFSVSKFNYPTWAELFATQPVPASPPVPAASEYDRVVFDPDRIYNNRGLYQDGVAVEASEDDARFEYEDPDALLQ